MKTNDKIETSLHNAVRGKYYTRFRQNQLRIVPHPDGMYGDLLDTQPANDSAQSLDNRSTSYLIELRQRIDRLLAGRLIDQFPQQ